MYAVKFIISAFALALCASVARTMEMSDEMKELIAMLHKTCVEEAGGISDDLITGTMKGNFPEDPALKCYMKCILIQGAGMDDDGVVDVEAIIAMLPEELQNTFGATMRKCGTQTGSDICDTAFKTNKCWYDNSPNDYFLF